MAEDKKKSVHEIALARFKRKVDACSDNRVFQVDDIKFAAGSPDNGYQWPQAIWKDRTTGKNGVNGGRPCLTINKLTQHIRQVTNDQRQNRPAVKVMPVDDKSDPEVAEILNGIIRHIEVNSNADIAYDTACDNQVTHGEGYFRVLTEYVDENSFDQEILVGRIRNSFSVYMDPDIQDPAGLDQTWCFITDLLEEDEFKQEFPDADPIDWDEVGTGEVVPLWFDGKKVRIAEYFYFEDEEATLCLWPDGRTTTDPEQKKAYEKAGIKPVNERSTTLKKVKWCKLNGQQILEERDWAGKFIPVIRVIGNEWEVEGKIIISGLVRNAKDAQRGYNYWASQEVEMLALAPKAPFIGAAGQFEDFEEEWDNANTVNYSKLEYNVITDASGHALPAPQRSIPPMMNQGIVTAKLGFAEDIKSTTGQYDDSLGIESNEKSGVAIKARQHEADVGTFHYIDNLSRGIRYLGRILVDLIPKVYDVKRIARIIGEDGEPDQAVIDPSIDKPTQSVRDAEGKEIYKIYNPSIGRYDVVSTVGPGYTTKRQEAAEFMAQVLQGNKELMAVIGDLYFKMLDVPGADEIADRIKKTLPPQLTQDEKEGGEPMVQTPDGPIPVEVAGQMIAQQKQQLQEAGEAIKKADMAGSQAKIADSETKRMDVQAKDAIEQAKLQIERDRLQIEMYEAETDRIKVENDKVKIDNDRQLRSSEIAAREAPSLTQ